MVARAVWQQIANSSDISRSSQTISLSNSHALLFGGEVKPRQPVDNKLYKIPLSVGTADQNAIKAMETSSAPSPRVGSASTTLSGKVYLFSGRGGEAMAPIEENGMLHVLDQDSAIWSTIGPSNNSSPFPQARSYHAMASDGTGTIYLHAGCPEKGRLADLWAFKIADRQWISLADAPGPQRGGTSIAYLNRKLYRMNGFDGKSEQGYALGVYDISTDSWSTITWTAGSGPSARSVSTLLAIKIQGKDALLTMFGESDPSNLGHQGAGKMLGDIWVFELDSEKWTKVETQGPEPQARGWFAADVLRDTNQIVVQGGLAEDNTRIGDAWSLVF
jgi:N-acetylneuraminic acid mutarotase